MYTLNNKQQKNGNRSTAENGNIRKTYITYSPKSRLGLYAPIESVIIRDKNIPKRAKLLYNLLLDHANKKTRQCRIYMGALAEELGYSIRNVQYAATELEERGLIKRYFQKTSFNMNQATLFHIIGETAPCYANEESTQKQNRSPLPKQPKALTSGTLHSNSVPGEHTCRQESQLRDSEKRNNNLLGEELSLPQIDISCNNYGQFRFDINDSDTLQKSPSGNARKERNINQDSSVIISDDINAKKKMANKADVVVKKGRKNTGQKATQFKTANNESRAEFCATEVARVEVDMPRPAEIITPKTQEQVNTDILQRVNSYDRIPDKMHDTVRFFLEKTGRAPETFNAKEIDAVNEVFQNHYPARVKKAIIKACDTFTRQHKNLTKLFFGYIAKMLRHQRSFVPFNEKDNKNEQALSMPVNEAKQILNELKPVEPMTDEQLKFLKTLKQTSEEKLESYLSGLQRDENGFYIFTDEADDVSNLTLEDYVALKFPGETHKTLHTDPTLRTHESYDEFPVEQKTALLDSFSIDFACAHCESPNNCALPEGYKVGSTRPSLALENVDGCLFLSTRQRTCMKCKFNKSVKKDGNFDYRMRNSKITAEQARQTFETYRPVNDATLVAEAQAYLAAKNKTPLVLAGKPGTGKTHLALAIALKVIEDGKQARIMNVPEMINELRHAAQEHLDFYGLMKLIKETNCLVLDDLGKETTSNAGLSYLYEIINYRYSHNLQTIITTNALKPTDLANKWNADKIEAIISRILEKGKWVNVDADNFRLKH